jgi:hypothetical protein
MLLALITDTYSILWQTANVFPSIVTYFPWQALAVNLTIRSVILLTTWQVRHNFLRPKSFNLLTDCTVCGEPFELLIGYI